MARSEISPERRFSMNQSALSTGYISFYLDAMQDASAAYCLFDRD
jgi:hypothetical protein